MRLVVGNNVSCFNQGCLVETTDGAMASIGIEDTLTELSLVQALLDLPSNVSTSNFGLCNGGDVLNGPQVGKPPLIN